MILMTQRNANISSQDAARLLKLKFRELSVQLTEDGWGVRNIDLLERQSSELKFINVPMSDSADGAISNLWTLLHDSKREIYAVRTTYKKYYYSAKDKGILIEVDPPQ